MCSERPKSKPALADRVYHSLFSRISNGEYPANSKLPPENTLAVDLGVSRPVLRAALERLRGEGMIYSRQGAGSYVRSTPGAPLGFAPLETLADIQRCYEFRMTIESDAAALAAERRDKTILHEIIHVLDLLSVAISPQHREDADLAFHMAVARGANNQYYEATLRALRDHINLSMKMHGQSLMRDSDKARENALSEHRAIADAIQNHDPDAARQLMRNHISKSRDRLFGAGHLDLRM